MLVRSCSFFSLSFFLCMLHFPDWWTTWDVVHRSLLWDSTWSLQAPQMGILGPSIRDPDTYVSAQVTSKCVRFEVPGTCFLSVMIHLYLKSGPDTANTIAPFPPRARPKPLHAEPKRETPKRRGPAPPWKSFSRPRCFELGNCRLERGPFCDRLLRTRKSHMLCWCGVFWICVMP